MAEQWTSPGPSDPETSIPPDLVIARTAAAQHGVVARRQLIAAGVSETVIRERLRRGHLQRLHRGVFAAGHRRLCREGFWLAAVLAAGDGAVLSHRDAAALHGIRPPRDGAIEVTTSHRPRRLPGIRPRVRRVLDAADATTVAAIPTTTVARTLVDLADVLPTAALLRALSEAERLGTLDAGAVDRALDRTRGRHGEGHGRLAAALAEHRRLGVQLVRSELEGLFLALVADHDLPRPRMNAVVEGVEVDALWPRERLVVELDGHAFHRARTAFQHDREKANDLLVAGYRVLRFTHADVAQRPRRVAARVGALLRHAPA